MASLSGVGRRSLERIFIESYHRRLRIPMKKTFQLAQEGKKPDRLLEATKHEIRKYIKRER